VSTSTSRSYVQWYRETSRDWATWTPGETVQPGDFGTFDKELRFVLSGHIDLAKTKSAARPGIRTVSSAGDISFSTKAGGNASPTLAGLGDLTGGVKITASRAHACFLHMDDVYESWVVNESEVLHWVSEKMTEWDIGQHIVMKRLEARRGFAAISQRGGASLEVSASAAADLVGAAEVSLQAGRKRSGFQFYEFGRGSTPAFSRTFRVSRRLWGGLLPWRREGPVLFRPDGRRYHGLAALPTSALAGAPPEARRYDPKRSALTPAELSAIAIADLFEEITSISDLGEVDGQAAQAASRSSAIVYTPLLAPLRPAPLAAADPADGTAPRMRATTADGTARLALFDQGDGEWWVEVSLTTREMAPAIVAFRYNIVGGGQRELLVPIDVRAGRRMPTSVARLPDYTGYNHPGSERNWEVANPVPLYAMGAWPPGILVPSVRATVSEATVHAWERVAADGPQDARQVIADALGERDDRAGG
jgi:hypothetical protein